MYSHFILVNFARYHEPRVQSSTEPDTNPQENTTHRRWGCFVFLWFLVSCWNSGVVARRSGANAIPMGGRGDTFGYGQRPAGHGQFPAPTFQQWSSWQNSDSNQFRAQQQAPNYNQQHFRQQQSDSVNGQGPDNRAGHFQQQQLPAPLSHQMARPPAAPNFAHNTNFQQVTSGTSTGSQLDPGGSQTATGDTHRERRRVERNDRCMARRLVMNDTQGAINSPAEIERSQQRALDHAALGGQSKPGLTTGILTMCFWNLAFKMHGNK